MEDLGDRIRLAAARVGGLNELAKIIAVPRRTLGNWLTGTSPKPGALEAIARNAAVSLDWLLTGEGYPDENEFSVAMKKHERNSPSEERVSDDEAQAMFSAAMRRVSIEPKEERFVRISSYNVSAAAGSGLVPVDEDEEPEEIVLARSFMRRIGASPEQSQVIFARGESMMPTIPDGSLLLIDRSKTDIDDNGVFVFRVGEGIKVKRARWRADERIDLVSDNQLGGYPPETYTRDEIATIVPIGRVMCIMRTP